MSSIDRFFPLDASVLLRRNGIFSEHQIYRNTDNEIFARKGNGYIRLLANNATSVNRIYWNDLDLAPHTWELNGSRMIFVPPRVKAA